VKSRRWLTAVFAISSLFNSLATPTNACGPFSQRAVLKYDYNPDLPLKNFLEGDLGVVLPSWEKSYLVAAYRKLSGKPFTLNQQEAIYKLWRHRIQPNAFFDFPISPNQSESQKSQLSSSERWQKVRRQVPGTKSINVMPFRYIPDVYDTYLNCLDNSFDNAANVLQSKIVKHGITSPFVKEWVAAQDLVFCHCGTPRKADGSWSPGAEKVEEPPLPALLDESADREAQDDRSYQHAASLFYAQQYDQSFKEFGSISHDKTSSYARLSRYMQPRCLIRKATIIKMSDEDLHSTFAEAENLLRSMLSDTNMSEFRQACLDLLGFVLFRSEPVSRLKQLAGQVMSDNQAVASAEYFRSLDDYTQLLDNLEGGPRDHFENEEVKMAKFPTISKDDDLSDWLITWQRNDKALFAHAVDRWHQMHSQAWLLVALHLAPLDIVQTTELLEAARVVPPKSSAYLTLGYEAARLRLQRGDKTEAINEIDYLSALALKRKLLSAANLLLDLRCRAPIDVAEFVKNSVRVPAASAYFDEYLDEQFGSRRPNKKQFDFVFSPKAAECMNERIPLRMLVNISASPKLTAKLRADAEQAAWVRAVILNDSDSTKKLLPGLERDYPKLAPLLKASGSGSEGERKFAAAFLILKNPGMRPYVTGGAPRAEDIGALSSYSDNWWSNVLPDQSITYDNDGQHIKSKLHDDDYPKLLSLQQSMEGTDNRKQLLSTGSAPTFLSGVVAQYANFHKNDPRVPEALYLAVRASHYGHREARTTVLSKKCFILLHSNYPKNMYTVRTPYYY
jgi:hypothetical protein